MSFPVVVLVSGEGTNLQAILDEVHGRDVEVVGVAASREGARGLARARAVGIETAVFAIADYGDRAERDRALADWIEGCGAKLVVLAGFMELLGPEFIGSTPLKAVAPGRDGDRFGREPPRLGNGPAPAGPGRCPARRAAA